MTVEPQGKRFELVRHMAENLQREKMGWKGKHAL